MSSENVVAMWRRRPLLLRRRGWGCNGCGRVFLVSRRRCARCGASSGFTARPLPEGGVVIAASHRGAWIEDLDQTRHGVGAVLLDLGALGRIACTVAASEAIWSRDELRQARLRLAVRRLSPATDLAQPISYGPKAVADVPERARLIRRRVEASSNER